MRFSEFKRVLQQKYRQGGPIKLMIPLKELYVYPSSANNLIKLVSDNRSVVVNGRWRIQPIAVSDNSVYIVCPFCNEIHSHGNASGFFEGVRVPHCNDPHIVENYEIIKPGKENHK